MTESFIVQCTGSGDFWTLFLGGLPGQILEHRGMSAGCLGASKRGSADCHRISSIFIGLQMVLYPSAPCVVLADLLFGRSTIWRPSQEVAITVEAAENLKHRVASALSSIRAAKGICPDLCGDTRGEVSTDWICQLSLPVAGCWNAPRRVRFSAFFRAFLFPTE